MTVFPKVNESVYLKSLDVTVNEVAMLGNGCEYDLNAKRIRS